MRALFREGQLGQFLSKASTLVVSVDDDEVSPNPPLDSPPRKGDDLTSLILHQPKAMGLHHLIWTEAKGVLFFGETQHEAAKGFSILFEMEPVQAFKAQ